MNIPGDDNKRDPERENLAVMTIAAQTANLIHIRVTFNVVTQYELGKLPKLLYISTDLQQNCRFTT